MSVVSFSALFLGDMRASVIEPIRSAWPSAVFSGLFQWFISVVYFSGLFLGDIEEAVFGGRFSGLFLGRSEGPHHLI